MSDQADKIEATDLPVATDSLNASKPDKSGRIVGVGVNMVELSRFARAIERRPAIVDKLLTSAEQYWCSRCPRPQAYYAGCFAAKQAVLKALGVPDKRVEFHAISVEAQDKGGFFITLDQQLQHLADEQSVTTLAVSLSYTQTHAVANVVALTPDCARPKKDVVSAAHELEKSFKEVRHLVMDQ